MDYKKYDQTVYVRMDKGDEMLETIIDICRKEKIESAVFSGIGACSRAELQTFLPDAGTFETTVLSGMLELVSMDGNVVTDDEMNYYIHAHAVFSYKDGDEHITVGGHIKSMITLYTGEIELRPVAGGAIKKQYCEETGTWVWKF